MGIFSFPPHLFSAATLPRSSEVNFTKNYTLLYLFFYLGNCQDLNIMNLANHDNLTDNSAEWSRCVMLYIVWTVGKQYSIMR